ncbi:hypothetical protein GC101_20135 [Paenibacillus sp. LMG 31459]|uniref:WYL domain-containing protein n=1 Tax=Paenibacillus phytohabitans TaxID=2654978 RepID=A0ABX1YK21_9BACL|nr:hypothetical protein [Paenibacillus phytohabitans]NOU81176.1 hypothetical protein [Paenibacillus phytohabitans]
MKVGQQIEIIYKDLSGKITQRIVKIYCVRSDKLLAKCVKSGGIRSFFIKSILAWKPVAIM